MQFPVAVEIFGDFLRNYAYTMQVVHKATSRLSIRQQISGSDVVQAIYTAEKILTDSLIPIYLPNKGRAD
jgi:hypothetical protein